MLIDLLTSSPKWRPAKAKATKAKLNKWDYTIFKGFCTATKTIDEMKKPPTEWEKMLASRISDKGLPPKIYTEFTRLNDNNNKNTQTTTTTQQFKHGRRA